MTPTIKEIKKILDNAPEGATHIDTDGDYWIMGSTKSRFHNGDGWYYCEPHDSVSNLFDLQAMIDQHREIDRLQEQVPKWVSAEARLPGNGSRIIMASDSSATGEGRFFSDKFTWANDDYWTDVTSSITHWMPLPTPLKGEEP